MIHAGSEGSDHCRKKLHNPRCALYIISNRILCNITTG